MENNLRQQLEHLLEKAEKSNETRVIEFFERVADIELPAQGDRYWLLEQFNTLVKAFEESKEDTKRRDLLVTATLFTMGRVWERYYTPLNKK